jgi:hypothetical protein
MDIPTPRKTIRQQNSSHNCALIIPEARQRTSNNGKF